jgi:hypothetical protein
MHSHLAYGLVALVAVRLLVFRIAEESWGQQQSESEGTKLVLAT